MVNSSNNLFWSVYNKVVEKGLSYAKQLMDNKNFGTPAPSTENSDKLFSVLEYLDIIKDSKYEYYHIEGLTNISNLINRL